MLQTYINILWVDTEKKELILLEMKMHVWDLRFEFECELVFRAIENKQALQKQTEFRRGGGFHFVHVRLLGFQVDGFISPTLTTLFLI